LRSSSCPTRPRNSLLLERSAPTLVFVALAPTDGGTGCCQVRLDVEDGIIALCDRIAMEQILENLLSNAIRYGSGKPIEVAFHRDGRRTQLSVGDQGVGISEEDQARMFEHFNNLRRTSPKGGFGVGLSRQIIRTMEGEITVSSSPGKGSVFTVRLPLQSGSEDNEH
jgi:signal transduction histidine kinase